MTLGRMVREFHDRFRVPVGRQVQFPPPARRQLRRFLLDEEYREYTAAENAGDVIEVADALADIVYVAFGTALEYGIDLDAVLEEVHRSNMTKEADPAGGKVRKGPDYEPPRIEAVLQRGRV